MKIKKYLGLVIIVLNILVITACGSTFPNLTDEEYNQTVEYAVGLLIKYSNNEQRRLVYVNAREEQKSRDRKARKEAQNAANENSETKAQASTPQQTSPAPATSVTPASTPAGNTNTEDSQETQTMTGENLAQGGNAENPQESNDVEEQAAGAESVPGAITMSAEDSQEIAEDLFLSYQGYSVSSTYPESSKSYVVNADKGNKLLVLRFDLYNGSDNDMNVNMLKYDFLFQVLLNGNNLGYTSVTFLPNDLSSYVGTIESRAHESLVVLTQISESQATNIQNLGLILEYNGIEQTVNLK